MSREILGQGMFQYRALRFWSSPDNPRPSVNDCHAITTDRDGRIVMLTNDCRNNLLAFARDGQILRSWEQRFPGAHGLEIVDDGGEDRYWITDSERQRVSVCAADGREIRFLGVDDYPRGICDPTCYRPTSTAITPAGDFFVSDGYGANFIHHFDADFRYLGSFGGSGDAPEKLKCPHAVWIDERGAAPCLLVCDRGHNLLKWFTTEGRFLRQVALPSIGLDPIGGLLPVNVTRFPGAWRDHIAVACLSGAILILDGSDRVVAAVGAAEPVYSNGRLQALRPENYTFCHPHDVCIDDEGAIYVAQWWSNRTYPVKLEPVAL